MSCQQVILGKSEAIHITQDELDSLPKTARDVIITSKIPVRSGAKIPEDMANGSSHYGTTLANQFAFKYLAGTLNNNVVWCQCTGGVDDQSIVFVSASEAGQNGIQFIGAAEYTIHNVAPRLVRSTTDSCINWCPVGTGVIDFWIEIDWDTPLETMFNFLVINN